MKLVRVYQVRTPSYCFDDYFFRDMFLTAKIYLFILDSVGLDLSKFNIFMFIIIIEVIKMTTKHDIYFIPIFLFVCKTYTKVS
jgi:hypothetical protein